MRFSHFFIARPIFAAVVALVITIIGAIGYTGLGITQLPEITPPTITVTTNYPGASSQTVADTVAAPIEQEINGVEGMIYMASQSTSDGNLSITVTFDVGTDIDRAQVLVQNRVSVAVPRLPAEVQRSGMLRAQALAGPVAGRPPGLARPDLRPGLHLQLRPPERPRPADAALRRGRRVAVRGARVLHARLARPGAHRGPRPDGRAGAGGAAGAERAGGGRVAGRAAGRLQERLPDLAADEGPAQERRRVREHHRQVGRRRPRGAAQGRGARGAGRAQLQRTGLRRPVSGRHRGGGPAARHQRGGRPPRASRTPWRSCPRASPRASSTASPTTRPSSSRSRSARSTPPSSRPLRWWCWWCCCSSRPGAPPSFRWLPSRWR